jgi:hypothetical protein
VVTVDAVDLVPLPWTRTQTFASFFEISIPALRVDHFHDRSAFVFSFLQK